MSNISKKLLRDDKIKLYSWLENDKNFASFNIMYLSLTFLKYLFFKEDKIIILNVYKYIYKDIVLFIF